MLDKRYLDFSSQLVNTNIGHQHPKVIAAIQHQAGELATIAPATANLMRGEAAKRILERAPAGFSKDRALAEWRSRTAVATYQAGNEGQTHKKGQPNIHP